MPDSQQLLLNLMLNAMDAMETTPASARRLTLEVGSNAAADIEIAIIDTGIGFSPNLAIRLFEPFMTTKPEGLGAWSFHLPQHRRSPWRKDLGPIGGGKGGYFQRNLANAQGAGHT